MIKVILQAVFICLTPNPVGLLTTVLKSMNIEQVIAQFPEHLIAQSAALHAFARLR